MLTRVLAFMIQLHSQFYINLPFISFLLFFKIKFCFVSYSFFFNSYEYGYVYLYLYMHVYDLNYSFHYTSTLLLLTYMYHTVHVHKKLWQSLRILVEFGKNKSMLWVFFLGSSSKQELSLFSEYRHISFYTKINFPCYNKCKESYLP